MPERVRDCKAPLGTGTWVCFASCQQAREGQALWVECCSRCGPEEGLQLQEAGLQEKSRAEGRPWRPPCPTQYTAGGW